MQKTLVAADSNQFWGNLGLKFTKQNGSYLSAALIKVQLLFPFLRYLRTKGKKLKAGNFNMPYFPFINVRITTENTSSKYCNLVTTYPFLCEILVDCER